MSRARGVALQLALARYLARWWPSAESAGAGRNGTDITGTPGIVWECKTARDFRPLEWCRQAKRHTAYFGKGMPVDWPVTVYFPDGLGEKSADEAIAMMPLREMVSLLNQAGYGGVGLNDGQVVVSLKALLDVYQYAKGQDADDDPSMMAIAESLREAMS